MLAPTGGFRVIVVDNRPLLRCRIGPGLDVAKIAKHGPGRGLLGQPEVGGHSGGQLRRNKPYITCFKAWGLDRETGSCNVPMVHAKLHFRFLNHLGLGPKQHRVKGRDSAKLE